MNYMIVYNHDRGEYSHHWMPNEASAVKVLHAAQANGRNVSWLVVQAPNNTVASEEADRISESYNYHHVADALSGA